MSKSRAPGRGTEPSCSGPVISLDQLGHMIIRAAKRKPAPEPEPEPEPRTSAIAAEVAAIAGEMASAMESVVQQATAPPTPIERSTTPTVSVSAHGEVHQSETVAKSGTAKLAEFNGPFARWARRTESTTTTRTVYGTGGSPTGIPDHPGLVGSSSSNSEGAFSSDSGNCNATTARESYRGDGLHTSPRARWTPPQSAGRRWSPQAERTSLAAAAADRAAAEAEASLEELRRLAY